MWTMCEFHDSNGNGLGDIRWTDKCTYFSSIDYCCSAYEPTSESSDKLFYRPTV